MTGNGGALPTLRFRSDVAWRIGTDNVYIRLVGTNSSVYGETPTYSYAAFNQSTGGIQLSDAALSGTASFKNSATNLVLNNRSNAGIYSVDYLSGLNSGNNTYQLLAGAAGSYTIAKRDVTVSGIIANGKTYDGTSAATLSNQGSLNQATEGSLVGLVGTETLTVTTTGSFTNQNAGDRTVNTSTTLGNGTGLVDNYNLTNVTGSVNATIAKRDVTVSGIIANGKTYDGTSAATLSNQGSLNQATEGSLVGLVGTETLAVTTTGSFTNQNAGDRTVNTSTTLGNGTGLVDNYNLTNVTGSVNATIAKRDVTVSGIIANDKTYDGTNVATFSNQGSLNSAEQNNAIIASPVFIAFPVATMPSSGPGPTLISQPIFAIPALPGPVVQKSNVGLVAGESLTVTTTGVFDSQNAGDRTVNRTTTLGNGANGGLASNYNLTNVTGELEAKIAKRDVTVSGIVANGKTYDGTNAATFSNQGALNAAGVDTNGKAIGLVAGESLIVTTTGSFTNQNAGDRTVNTSTTLGNGTGLVDNYNLTNVTGSVNATIAKRDVTVSGIIANGKTYDGSSAATLSNQGSLNQATEGSLVGLVGTETLAVTTTGSFTNQNAGDRTVNTSTTLGNGTGLVDNYNLTNATGSVNATIAKRDVTVSGIIANGKTYDGSSAATLSNQGSLNQATEGSLVGLVGTETLAVTTTGSFTNQNAGDRTVNTSTTLGNGTGLVDNYNLTNATGSVNATIAKRDVTVSGIIANGKTYDGSSAATLSNQGSLNQATEGSLVGLVGTETLTVTTTGSFTNQNAGDRTVNTSTTLGNGTGLVDNYNLTNPVNQTQAAIDKKQVAVTAVDSSKVVGETDPSLSFQVGDGLIGGDTLTGSLARLAGEDSGQYSINQGSLNNQNYEIVFTPGVFTINSPPVVGGDEPITFANQLDINTAGEPSGPQMNNSPLLATEGATIPGTTQIEIVDGGLNTGELNLLGLIGPNATEDEELK